LPKVDDKKLGRKVATRSSSKLAQSAPFKILVSRGVMLGWMSSASMHALGAMNGGGPKDWM
jgi:hypothetical protein